MKFSNELKVGLAIIASAVILFVGLRFFQNVPLFQTSYEMQTHLQDSGGLIAGNAVRISGVKVGDVKAVELAEDGKTVRVRFTLFEDVQLTDGSSARVTGIGAMGGLRLSIDPGPPDASPLSPGTTIPADTTADVLTTLGEQGPALLLRTDQLLQDASLAINAATGTLNATQADVNRTLSSIRQTTESINQILVAETARIDRMMQNAELASAGLEQFTTTQSDSLAIAIAQLNTSLRRIDASLSNFEQSSTRVDNLLLGIEAGEGSVGKFLQNPSLYDELEVTAVQLNALLEDLKQNPSRYLRDLSIVKLF